MFSDLHLEAGSQLGAPDLEYGNTRMRDAEKALQTIAEAADGADVLIFAGDLTKGPRPGPLAYRIFMRAFEHLEETPGLLLVGNHDYLAEGTTSLHVVGPKFGRGLLGEGAVAKPEVKRIGDLQVACLPWTSPGRLFEQAPDDPAMLHRLVSDKLHDVAVGLAEQLDPSKPSLLVAHWYASGPGFQIPDVMRGGEVVLDAARLEALGFDVCLFGHWHGKPDEMRIGPRSWYIGAPMRGGFGEEDIQPGFVEVEWPDYGSSGAEIEGKLERGEIPMAEIGAASDAAEEEWPQVRHVPLEDRKLITLDLDPSALAMEGGDGIVWKGRAPEFADAIVRLRYTCTPAQATAMAKAAESVVKQLHEVRVLKVIGPLVTILAAEREARTDLAVDADPLAALREWLMQEAVPEEMQPEVLRLAKELIR